MSEEQGFMEKLRHLQDNCLKMLIQPERIQYMEHDLGCQTQYVEDQMYLRKDFCVQNRQNFSMACTYYERSPSRQTTGGCRDSFSFTDNQQRPSILTYCHSQTGNRMEGLPLLTFCAKLRINLLLFDFAGCGHSGGQYVSLGWFEHEDLKRVLDHAKAVFNPKDMFLWGRSMGAVAAIRFAALHPAEYQALVLDSPFDDLLSLTKSIATRKLNISSLFLSLPLMFISKRLTEIFGVNLLDLKPKGDIIKISKPVYFISCKSEDLLPEGCVQGMYQVCPSTQKVITIEEGSHGSEREEKTLEEAVHFLSKHKQIEIVAHPALSKNIKSIFNRSCSNFSVLANSQAITSGIAESRGTNYDPFLSKQSIRGMSSSVLMRSDSRSVIHANPPPAKASVESKVSSISGYNPLKSGLDGSKRSITVSNFSFTQLDATDTPQDEGIQNPPLSLKKLQVGESSKQNSHGLKVIANQGLMNRYSKPFHDRRNIQTGHQQSSHPFDLNQRSTTDILGQNGRDSYHREYHLHQPKKTPTSNAEFGSFIQGLTNSIQEDSTLKDSTITNRPLSLSRPQPIQTEPSRSVIAETALPQNGASSRALRVLQMPVNHSLRDLTASPLILKHSQPRQTLIERANMQNSSSQINIEMTQASNVGDQMKVRQFSPLMVSFGQSTRGLKDTHLQFELSQFKTSKTVESNSFQNSVRSQPYRPILDLNFDKENIRPNYR
jgi:pimeloyl-ACP methyl ester carboxylesterase